MEQRWFETTLGPVPLWGRFSAFRGDKPAVFVIRGAFSEPHVLYEVADKLPELDFAYAHLPGMHSPPLGEPSVESFTLALEAAARAAFPDRPINVLGNSIGGLVALGFRKARSIIALEPPLLTGGLWPLQPFLVEKARTDPAIADWVWNVFGVGADGSSEPRDYRHLIANLRTPTGIVLGGEPLEPPRAFERLPSLVSEAAREGLASVVRVITVGGVGHNIPRDAARVVYNFVRQACGLENVVPS